MKSVASREPGTCENKQIGINVCIQWQVKKMTNNTKWENRIASICNENS